jgi:hypothetical protein
MYETYAGAEHYAMLSILIFKKEKNTELEIRY